jgi:hypothetical protein
MEVTLAKATRSKRGKRPKAIALSVAVEIPIAAATVHKPLTAKTPKQWVGGLIDGMQAKGILTAARGEQYYLAKVLHKAMPQAVADGSCAHTLTLGSLRNLVRDILRGLPPT